MAMMMMKVTIMASNTPITPAAIYKSMFLFVVLSAMGREGGRVEDVVTWKKEGIGVFSGCAYVGFGIIEDVMTWKKEGIDVISGCAYVGFGIIEDVLTWKKEDMGVISGCAVMAVGFGASSLSDTMVCVGFVLESSPTGNEE